jgi:hypothetical protein
MYTEFSSDPKVQILAFEDQRHYVMSLCLKGRGILDAEYSTDRLRSLVIAKALGLDPIACAEANRRLVEAGLVDEKWQPLKWSKRQYTSDHDAAERKRRQRQRERVTGMSRDSHADRS